MLLLGRADRIVPPYFRGFLVYLHQRGQFWPRADMQDLTGQSRPVDLRPDTELAAQFFLTRVSVYCAVTRS